jgi:hypothetical protein
MFRIAIALLATLLALAAIDAHAYIGPGAGVGFLGSLWAWLVGVVVVLLAIVIWPLRWMLRRLRSKAAAARSRHSAPGD